MKKTINTTILIITVLLSFLMLYACEDAGSDGNSKSQDKAPDAPTDINAVAGNAKVTISWKAPFDTGIINGDGSFGVITKYTVYYSERTITDTSVAGVTAVDLDTGTTTEITGLTNDIQYYFVVRAHNATGEGVVSDEVTATPQFPDGRAPGAPTDINVLAGNTKVTISWTAPTDTGIINGDGTLGVITKYTVYYSERTITDTSATGVLAVDAGTGTTTEITGLTNDTQYYFVVSTHNATGEGVVSDEVTAMPQLLDDVAPGVPTDVNVRVGNTKVRVSWTAPTDTGIINGDGTLGVITKYTVYYSERTITDTSVAGVTAVDLDTGTTTEITGLTNDIQYYFVVRAHNATGESGISDVVSATPKNLEDKAPGVPTDINAVAGDTKVTISWTAPVDTGIINGDGSFGVITKYTVYYGDGDTTSDSLAVVEVDAETTTKEIAGLTNGVLYYFLITAHNATGASEISQESGVAAMPQFPDGRAPGAPTDINVIAGNTKMTISWTAPTDTGLINGDETPGVITKYTVYYSERTITDTSATGVTAVDVNTGTTTEIVGLTNDTQYYFVISTHNATGEGVVSDEFTAMPQLLDDVAPSALTDVKTFAGNAKVSISWTAPVDTGIINGDGTLGVITKYTVYYSERTIMDTSVAGVTAVDVNTGTTTEITGLTNGVLYYFLVTAHNATGESAVSNLVSVTPATVLEAWQSETRGANDFSESTEGTAIATATDLKAITVDGTYHLTADIDLNNEEWAPLHSHEAPFTGTLHGNGHTIYNLKIDAPDANYQGLFVALSGATINNLGIGVSSIIASAAAGGLAGLVKDESTLTNIAVGAMFADSEIVVGGTTMTEGTTSSMAGGIVGYLWSNLIDGLNDGLVVRATGATTRHGNIGGLVGRNIGRVTGSASGDVSAVAGESIGGLVGSNLGQVAGSASGDVSSDSGKAVGGLVGSNSSQVIGSASGNVSSVSGSDIGGLVGLNAVVGQVTGSASGDVSSDSGNSIGGLVGFNTFNGQVTGSASGDVSSVSGSDVGGLVGLNAVVGQVTGSASGDVSSVSGSSIGGLVGSHLGDDRVTGSASGDVSSVSGSDIGGLVGRNRGQVTGFASGTVSGRVIGGLVGRNHGQVTGVAIGWVMTTYDNAQTDNGALIGSTYTESNNGYYNSAGGDHVGSIDVVSENRINENETGATGERGTNGLGTGIDGIAYATATNMPLLTEGTEDGEWTFTAGEWPRINFSDSVNDFVDYTTSPPQPTNFFD